MRVVNKRALGLSLIILSIISSLSNLSITGNVTGISSPNYFVFISLLGLIFGIILIAASPNLVKRSLVKSDSKLLRLAQELEGNKIVQNEADDLIQRLNNGNDNPGIGTKHLFKNIRYLRGRNGARVYFRPYEEKGENGEIIRDGYEILAWAIGTGQGAGKNQNERKVIKRLRELYE